MPTVADLFCGAGGAGMGLHRAGFEVIGFDIEPQPNYPFEFHLTDALIVDLIEFDMVWASPPCQRYSRFTPNNRKELHWDSIPPTREFLVASGKPYIIENVPGSSLKVRLLLNGPMFGRLLLRERWFESSMRIPQPFFRHRLGPPLHFGGNSKGRKVATTKELAGDMGINWMTRAEMGQAVPPAYAEYIGHCILAHIL